ncbi:MAG: DNA-binding response regulator, partial [Gemmatimonadetes bacterium]|nr:DNA-binding response regulator [Gemmatimonadota bacterium]
MSESPATNDLRLLLIDDEEVIHNSVGDFLNKMGYQILHAYNGEEGLKTFAEEGADIVISDIKMPGLDGLDLLREFEQRGADIDVILITGNSDMDTAIEALRRGAFDFFNKPVKLHELIASLERTQRYQAMRREKDRIQEQLELLQRSGGTQTDPGEIIGESRAIKDALALVEKVSGAERTTVLIRGESGTGKELFARAIHDKSPRAAAPFVSLNCTAIPETLFESELFGHERGAFTDAKTSRKGMFELSGGGTLFLDEIGDMSQQAQAKILRALEERQVRRVGGDREISIDVRLVTATHQDLHQLQEEGLFRQDLYFRLNVFAIELPPLRARGDDILLLAYHFLHQYTTEFGKDIDRIEADAQNMLRQYHFPGNIRELRNIIERAVILCDGPALTAR